jgi:hypothetical protein
MTTLYAAIPETSFSLINLQDLTNVDKLLPHLIFLTSDFSSMGYTNVGKVEIDVELLPPDQIVGNAVLALRAKAANIRAKATAEATKLEGMAQQLLAIENKPTEV